MQSLFKILFLLTILTGLFSCNPTKNIVGTYRSNFAVHGFFITKIILNKDLTFEYRQSGDMFFDTSYGQYKIDRHYVILFHEGFNSDSSQYEKCGNIWVLKDGLNHTHSKGQEKYFIGHNKLFICDSSYSIIKKQFGASKNRQFILFGKHWYNQKYYLKKIK